MIRLTDIRQWLNRLDAIVIYGAGKDIRKPKKESRALTYFLDWLDFEVLSFLDSVDSRIFFKGRTVRTHAGRVRSRGERRIVAFFRKHKIRFKYEPELVLGKVKLHPDFYLPEYKTYLEFWGMVLISPKYRAIMKIKKKLYEKHGIPVVSLLPKHLNDLEKNFSRLLEQTTGKSIDLALTQKGG